MNIYRRMIHIIIGAFSILLNVMLIGADICLISKGENVLGCRLILLLCFCNMWCAINYMFADKNDDDDGYPFSD